MCGPLREASVVACNSGVFGDRKRDATAPRQHKCNCADEVPAGFITRCSTKKVINPGKLNATTVKERLRSYHQAILDGAIGDLMTDKGTYAWFKVADRPSRPSDGLGPYKLMPKVAGIFEISVEDQARLCTYLGIDSESWDRAGSVVVDCFDWWTTEKYTGARMRRPSWKSFLKSSRCTTHICASSTKSLTTVGCATCTTASVSR